MRRGKYLQHGNLAQRPKSCNWLNDNRRRIVTSCLLTRNSITTVSIIHKIFVCGYVTVESNFQILFSVNVWCAVLDDQLIGPFIFLARLTVEAQLQFLLEELPRLSNKRGRMYFQNDEDPPHFSRKVRNFLNNRFLGRWIVRGGPHNWSPMSPDLTRTRLLCMGMDERNDLQRDALLGSILDAAERMRNSQPKL